MSEDDDEESPGSRRAVPWGPTDYQALTKLAQYPGQYPIARRYAETEARRRADRARDQLRKQNR
jgi:hypothetical protein